MQVAAEPLISTDFVILPVRPVEETVVCESIHFPGNMFIPAEREGVVYIAHRSRRGRLPTPVRMRNGPPKDEFRRSSGEIYTSSDFQILKIKVDRIN